MTYYPFGPLAPDRNPRLNDGFMRVADGVLPTVDGYKPVGQWVQAYGAMAEAPKGGATFVSQSGITSIFAGTTTGLYRAFSGSWELLSTGFSLQDTDRWRFAQFGPIAIATNGSDTMQKIDLSTGAVSELGGAPPKFESLAVVKGFLVGTVMNGDVMTVAWSGAYNAESWDFGSNQSDYYTLPTGGRVNGIFGGEFGLILQRNRLVRLDYVGGNLILDPNEVSSNIGCVSPHTAVQWGNLGFFLSDAGFMQWDGNLTPIGKGAIDDEFRADVTAADWDTISVAVDPVAGVVMWSTGSKIYCYDWALQKWSTITYAAPIIFGGVTRAIDIDEQDPAVGALDDDIDGVGLAPFDDTEPGGNARLYVFSSGYALGAFTGTPMAATFTGNDIEVYPGRRADIRMIRPDIDAASGLTVTLAGKATLAGSATSYSATTIQTSGDMPIRASGRYLRPTIAIAAGTAWTHAKGYDVVGRPGAGR